MPQDSNVHAVRLWDRPPPGIYICGNACIVCQRDRNIVTFPVSVAMTIPLDVVMNDKTTRDEAAGLSHEGILGICERCIKNAAKLFHLGDVEPFQDEIAQLYEDKVALAKQLEDAQEVIASYEVVIAKGPKRQSAEPLPDEQPLPLG